MLAGMSMTSALSVHVQDVCFRTKEDRISMKAIRKAQQITGGEIATVAATGVARALDARQAAGMELSSEELSHIDGGSLSELITKAGGDLLGIMKKTGLLG